MKHDLLLPLYDPFTRLAGAGAAHRRLVEQADIRPGQRVLEIGCGTGNLLLLARGRHPEAAVVGLDPDPRALARARRKAAHRSLPVELDRGFADDLPYPDGSVDRVLSAFMLHHVEPADRPAVLREAHRVLRPGGSLHLVDFGGAGERTGGLLARLVHREGQAHSHAEHQIGHLMVAAGFTDPVETAGNSRLLGPYAFYRAQR